MTDAPLGSAAACTPEAAATPSLATCPLCHTSESTLSTSQLEAGGSWKCRVCGQFWDAERLRTAASSRAWALTLSPAPPWSVHPRIVTVAERAS